MTKLSLFQATFFDLFPDLAFSHRPPGKTFSLQGGLPRLPVPDLDHTLEHYLFWVKPLLGPRSFHRTKMLVEHFSKNEGPVLQDRLLSFAEEAACPNWLYLMWLESYLEGRAPLPVTSNVFYRMEHVDCPPESRQASRATSILVGALDFYRSLVRGNLEPDRERGEPLCMVQYLNLFGSCRIPALRRDRVCVTELEEKRKQREIAIFRKGHLFFMPVMDRWGNPLSYPELFAGIWELLQRDLPPGPGVGVFTALPRDRWARIRNRMITSHPENEETFSRLERVPFVLCLDDTEARDDEAMARAFFLGQSENRWFDKTLQFIVLPDGEAGVNMEHSLVDGSPNARLLGAVISSPVGYHSDLGRIIPMARQVDFLLDPVLEEELVNARRSFQGLDRGTVLRVLRFSDFGRERIRNCWVSPDAFVQMAIQLAQFRVFGRCHMAYEAVMTRRFLFGRTEAMRPVSTQVLTFIRSMEEAADREVRTVAFREACEEHVRRIGMCKQGLGVDRHLFGLLEIFRRYGESLDIKRCPAIYLDRGWKVLKHNRISTSTTSSVGLVLAGYAPVVEDGFGVRYMTKPEAINFNVTARGGHSGDLDRMVRELERALTDIMEMFVNQEIQGASSFSL